MKAHAAITVHRSREEVEQSWRGFDHPPAVDVRFVDAPGDRGTEIHVELRREAPGGRLGEVVAKVAGAVPLAKVKDDLRRFKQLVGAGEIARSDGAPEGERVERKLKQRPAQPLDQAELERAGV